ncbi:response regulator transcription factor [Abditibacterium utsteinense]|nr:response regulator [Abditibacterium utsteinense]
MILPKTPAPKRFEPTAFFGTPQILVVEDDPHIARLIEVNLQKAGFGCRVENNGRLGLHAFEQMQPHLVVLDLMLPDATGYEICAKIRKTSATPIIMVTARSEPRDQLQGLKVGADDYITKPFDVTLLMARVAAQLRRVYRYGVAVEGESSAAARPAGWLSCDGCSYMGPRDKFEEIGAQGLATFACPHCSQRLSHLAL